LPFSSPLQRALPSRSIVPRNSRMTRHRVIDQSPNHALQRTAPAVTLAAPPPSPTQPSRQPPPSLSLGSLGDSHTLCRNSS
jgi:hypothetical protein